MATKSALSTWVSLDVHQKFREHCNQKGVSLSEGLKDLVLKTLGLSNNIEENPQTPQIHQIIQVLGKKKSEKCKNKEEGYCSSWIFNEEDKEKLQECEFKNDKGGWTGDYLIKVTAEMCAICHKYGDAKYKFGEN